jgi:hypothetical protein
MVYKDDGILCGPDKNDIDACLLELNQRFEITDEGDISRISGCQGYNPIHWSNHIDTTTSH